MEWSSTCRCERSIVHAVSVFRRNLHNQDACWCVCVCVLSDDAVANFYIVLIDMYGIWSSSVWLVLYSPFRSVANHFLSFPSSFAPPHSLSVSISWLRKSLHFLFTMRLNNPYSMTGGTQRLHSTVRWTSKVLRGETRDRGVISGSTRRCWKRKNHSKKREREKLKKQHHKTKSWY